MSAFLLVTPDTDFEAQVKRAFDGQVDVERWWEPKLPRLHPTQAVQAIAAQEPQVVVLGPGLPTPAALDLAAGFDLDHSEICVVLVAKAGPRLFEHALRSGVRDIIPLGADDAAVHEVLDRAEATAQRRQRASSQRVRTEAPRARVITVMSPKGGAGKTTIASNLAVRLAAAAPDRVALIDLDLQFGDAGSALGLGPQSTVADAARASDKLDSTTLKVFLEPRPGGLYLLAGPQFPAEADDIDAATVGHMIDILAGEFDFVVVDTASGLDEYVLAAADRSDDLVLVCTTDVPSVRGLRKALDAFDMLGMTSQRRHLVLNRADARVGLTPRDVESTLGVTFDAAIPSSRSVPISTNQGSPVTESEPRSMVAKALTQFADRFLVRTAPKMPMPVGAPAGTARWFPRKDV
jgi:pilus assembly protein CpaE